MRVNNCFLLEIPKPVQDEILLGGGLKLYMDASWRPEWHATTQGTVAYLPRHITNVSAGEEVAISYYVIAARTYPSYDHSFFPTIEGSRYWLQWRNGKGQWLTKRALPTPTRSLAWVAFLQDDRMAIIDDGVQGSESDVDRYLSQFSFGDTGTFQYTNQLDINGKIFWKADKNSIFAKRNQNGELISVSDKVIMTPIEEDVTARHRILNILPANAAKATETYLDRGRVVSGGGSIGLQQGDIAGFEPRFCERYELWGKEYFLVKQSRIDVIWQHQN